MGLYDSVDRGKPKPKRLTGPIALCCALFLLFGGLTYWACHYQFRFHAFVSDLTDSTRDARSTETFRVTVNGSEADVWPSICVYITSYRPNGSKRRMAQKEASVYWSFFCFKDTERTEKNSSWT